MVRVIVFGNVPGGEKILGRKRGLGKVDKEDRRLAVLNMEFLLDCFVGGKVVWVVECVMARAIVDGLLRWDDDDDDDDER